ncbi:Ig-like domain-containing protein [Chitinophagaceae bacterium 26-R-25]|nr:Ig-like domain-containing protein [Chitinophagaceae bacterium 26-R-25]
MMWILPVSAQVTVPSGSYIIDMGANAGIKPNGLRPYGIVDELIKYYNVPVMWVVRAGKAKDAVDYTIEGHAYKGGLFIISKNYITGPVQTAITQWTAATSVTSSNGYTRGLVTAPVLSSAYTFNGANVETLNVAPVWTLDAQNGSMIQPFFTNAGIPSSQYNWTSPAQLSTCNDIFVLPHSNPTWATHGNLYSWNLNAKGAIWVGCHAGSTLSNTYNPNNVSQQMNFLVNKVSSGGNYIAPVAGSTNYAQNSLVLFGNHGNGTPPFNTNTSPAPSPQTGNIAPADDWVSQFIGVPDAATLNGSEQIYMPVVGGGWLSTTKIITYDPSAPDVPGRSPGVPAVIAYGRGLGDPNRGLVMYESGHSLNKGTVGDVPAQRAFFNWSFVAAKEKAVQVGNIKGILADSKVYTNTNLSVSASSPAGSALTSYTWACIEVSDGSSIGSFSPNNNSSAANTVFLPTNVTEPTPVIFKVTVTDQCGRTTTSVQTATLMPPPHPPVPQNDLATIQTQCIVQGMSTTVNVTTNDTDPDGDLNTSSVLLQNPANAGQYGTSFTAANVGKWTTDSTNVTFVPDQNFYGSASITYKICDNTPNTGTAPFLGPLCATATLTAAVGSPDVHGCYPGSTWDIAGTDNATAQTNTGVTNPVNALGSPDYDPAVNTTYAVINANNDVLTLDYGAVFTSTNYDTSVVYFASGTQGSSITAAISYSADGVNFTSAGTSATTSNSNGASFRFAMPSGGLRYIRIQRSAGSATLLVDAVELENWDCTPAVLTANDDNVSTPEDVPVTIAVTANDNNPGDLPLTLTILNQPAHGRVSINTDNTITYLNNTDYPSGGNATDQFVYRICNSQGSCSSGTVTINIKDDGCSAGQYKPIDTGNPISATFTGTTETIDAMIREDGGNATTNFGNATTTEIGKKTTTRRRFLLAIPDAQYQAKIPANAIIQSASLRLTITGGDNATYKMGAYQSTGNPMWNEAQVTWNIRATGNSWTNPGSDFAAGALSSLYLARGTAPNNGANGSQPVFNISSAVTDWQNNIADNRGIMIGQFVDSTQVDKRLIFGTSENGTVAYRPLFTITYVLPLSCQNIPNRAPLANPDTASTIVAQPLTINVLANDGDADAGTTLTIQSATMLTPSRGTLMVNGTTLTYTPNNSSLIPRTDTIQYVVSDGSLTDVAYVYVKVKAGPPNVNADYSEALSGTTQVIDLQNNTNPIGADNDPNNYTLANAVIKQSPANGTYSLNGNILTYIPNAGWYGTDTMIYQRTQIVSGCGTGLSDTALVKFTVLNQPPTARDTALQINECRPFNFSTTSFTDPEGEPCTIDFDVAASHGTLISNPDGTYTYTPENGFTGTDVIQYHVVDPGGLSSATQTITLNIAPPPANQPPIAQDDPYNTTTGDGVTLPNEDLYLDVEYNDSDPEGNELVVSLGGSLQLPAHGTVTVLLNGTVLYQPDGNYTGVDQFQYRLCNTIPPSGSGCPQLVSPLCNVATVTVLIQPLITLPVVLSDFKVLNVNCTSHIIWNMAMEDNLDHFELQRSVDGINFGKIASVAPKGTNNTSYSYDDKTAGNGKYFYRLKMINYDGGIKYSFIATINNDCNKKPVIYPIPTTGTAYISGLRGKEVIYVQSDDGRLLQVVRASNATQAIDLNYLPSGVYILKVVVDNESVSNFKVIKN